MDGAPTPRYPAHFFSSSLASTKLWAMAKGGTGSQSSLKEQKLGFAVGRQEKGSSRQHFPSFLLPKLPPPFLTAPSRGSFFPFLCLLQEYAK